VIEYIIAQLKPHLISKQKKVLNLSDFNTSEFAFVLILNLICTHGVVDLRLPISDGSCSTAQYIKDMFKVTRNLIIFSKTTINKILNTCKHPQSTFEYPKEKKEIIKAFITFYFNLNETKSD
jgi:hypothetical protein